MTDERTLTVAEVLTAIDRAVLATLPGPVWVRGEVTGLHRTPRGAVFFRLADSEADGQVLDVLARGVAMAEVDRVLTAAGVGSLRNGIELRIKGTIGLARSQSSVRLSVVAVDPEFTIGRLAMDRDRVLRLLSADGSLDANRRLELPLVPLRVGLVTSRGSAAHGDFLHQLGDSGFRFRVKTAHTPVQGEEAPALIGRALHRVAREPVDVVALVRGGGAKLDLAVFDSETVGRAVAATPVPVITGIGHEIDDTVADRAAAIALKTPTAAGEWLVSRVRDFADRVETARRAIGEQARRTWERAERDIASVATSLAGVRSTLGRQHDMLDHHAESITTSARNALAAHRNRLGSMTDLFTTVGVDSTLRRGFALVTGVEGRVVRSSTEVTPGDRVRIRFADGTVPAIVEEP